MSITDLFCTPEQGRRIAELVPELTSAFMWAQYGNIEPFITYKKDIVNGALIEYDCTFAPALTLQELRDLVKMANLQMFERQGLLLLDSFDDHELENLLQEGNAVELAEWAIERLGEL